MLSVLLFEMVDTTLVLPSGRGSTKMEGIWSTEGLFTTSKLDMTEQMKTIEETSQPWPCPAVSILVTVWPISFQIQGFAKTTLNPTNIWV